MEFKEKYTILEYANIPSVNITRMEFKGCCRSYCRRVRYCVNITRMEFKECSNCRFFCCSFSVNITRMEFKDCCSHDCR